MDTMWPTFLKDGDTLRNTTTLFIKSLVKTQRKHKTDLCAFEGSLVTFAKDFQFYAWVGSMKLKKQSGKTGKVAPKNLNRSIAAFSTWIVFL